MQLKANKDGYHLRDQEGNPVPGVGDAVFGPSSEDYLNQPQTVQFTRKVGMLPQSALEAIALRAYSNDPTRWDCQRTRLGAIYVPIKGQVFVAFDDIPDAEKNIVLAKAQEGYELNKANKELVIKGKTLKDILERARADCRLLPVPRDGHVKAAIAQYGDNLHFRAIAGPMAPVNAKLIQREDAGHLWMLAPSIVLSIAGNNEGIVRPVGLSGGCGGSINDVSAYDGFYSRGRVRGVRNAKEFSR